MQQSHLPADMNLWESQQKAGSRCWAISSSTEVRPLRWQSRKKGELLTSLQHGDACLHMDVLS